MLLTQRGGWGSRTMSLWPLHCFSSQPFSADHGHEYRIFREMLYGGILQKVPREIGISTKKMMVPRECISTKDEGFARLAFTQKMTVPQDWLFSRKMAVPRDFLKSPRKMMVP